MNRPCVCQNIFWCRSNELFWPRGSIAQKAAFTRYYMWYFVEKHYDHYTTLYCLPMQSHGSITHIAPVFLNLFVFIFCIQKRIGQRHRGKIHCTWYLKIMPTTGWIVYSMNTTLFISNLSFSFLKNKGRAIIKKWYFALLYTVSLKKQ